MRDTRPGETISSFSTKTQSGGSSGSNENVGSNANSSVSFSTGADGEGIAVSVLVVTRLLSYTRGLLTLFMCVRSGWSPTT